MQSANEEILSSNEELQSTNEELDTAKEELQSVNEELNTVNEELRFRNEDVEQFIRGQSRRNGKVLAFDAVAAIDSGAYSAYPFTSAIEPSQVSAILPGRQPTTSASSPDRGSMPRDAWRT